jgi:hypothetical protein
MTKALHVPEEHLAEVVEIIRKGLKAKKKVSRKVKKHLTHWCQDMEFYIKDLQSEE